MCFLSLSLGQKFWCWLAFIFGFQLIHDLATLIFTLILKACKSKGIKLCGALAAAGMIAAHSSKHLPDHQREKYAVVTLIDCRSTLDPVLRNNQKGKPYFRSISHVYYIYKGLLCGFYAWCICSTWIVSNHLRKQEEEKSRRIWERKRM